VLTVTLLVIAEKILVDEEGVFRSRRMVFKILNRDASL